MNARKKHPADRRGAGTGEAAEEGEGNGGERERGERKREERRKKSPIILHVLRVELLTARSPAAPWQTAERSAAVSAWTMERQTGSGGRWSISAVLCFHCCVQWKHIETPTRPRFSVGQAVKTSANLPSSFPRSIISIISAHFTFPGQSYDSVVCELEGSWHDAGMVLNGSWSVAGRHIYR